MPPYPKRLIEVDLPIKRISAHARREKSIRHGHISTLHIWWARRPLAACRAVICAALWPDPADEFCPPAFREAAAKILRDFARKIVGDTRLANEHCSPENFKRWTALVAQAFSPVSSGDETSPSESSGGTPLELAAETAALQLRSALLDFIADFANWDNSTVREYLDASRALTAIAHASLSDPNFKLPADGADFSIENLKSQIATLPRPLVVDPFAGGGSIPLEALRVGADAFASDLNPVPVLLNKVVLEYIPRFANTEIRIPKSEWTKHWMSGQAASGHAEGVKENSPGLRDSGSATLGQRNKNQPHPEGMQPPAGKLDEKTGDLVLHGLADAVRYWGAWIKAEAEKELAEFYPKDADGATPIAYLWARTIQCEGPGCGAEVPLIRSFWLAKKANRSVALQLVPNKKAKRVDFKIIVKQRGGWVNQDEVQDPKAQTLDPAFDGTVKRGSATCPCCGYTTPVARVRAQLKSRRGGANDARLHCVVSLRPGEAGRHYRLPVKRDEDAVQAAVVELGNRKHRNHGGISIVPDEKLDIRGIRHTWGMIYGLDTWENHFTPRQLVALTTLSSLIRAVGEKLASETDSGLAAAVQTCLSLNFNRVADLANSLCGWKLDVQCPTHLFARQAVPMVWDFSESVCLSESSGSWHVMTERLADILAGIGSDWRESSPQLASATTHPLPDDSASALITDPPYYDAVPYAYLSDFFYVWLRRNLFNVHPDLFKGEVVPKDEEIVVDRPHELSNSTHDIAFYERELTKAFNEGRRVVRPDGVGTIVFASKTTASWEAILKAVVDAGWIITGSWPIDTEMETRVSAQGQARLASSVHLVCRPRENPDGSVRTDEIGDWRDVLQELPRRIHEWMPRLAEEGVVGADAIFACLGPALEIFSRYSRVEKASGETVTLKEYLEQVWAAVAKEALGLVFKDADTTGFEPDARLTAMWLWTLNAGSSAAENAGNAEEETDDDEIENRKSKIVNPAGFVLEYDAARKIAQGLGAHLEDLASLVEIKGDSARLLPVGERSGHLFGKEQSSAPGAAKKKKANQSDFLSELMGLPEDSAEAETAWGEKTVSRIGETTLDRIHQSMILFAAGRSEAMKRFLVDEGAGRDPRFWRLAQALSALYPGHTEEKRWVDGVLARKKGLGF